MLSAKPTNAALICMLIAAMSAILQCGCWAPLSSPGIPAFQLSDEYRIPSRTIGPPLNLSQLTIRQPADYLLGANDVISVTIPELRDGALPQTISATVMSDGKIHLPMAGSINVGGLNLIDAQRKINDTYADGILEEPQATLVLETKATVGVLVLGQVDQPGVHYLPRYENDVGHAIAAAGGVTTDAADMIEVHRKPVIRKSAQEVELNQNSIESSNPRKVSFAGAEGSQRYPVNDIRTELPRVRIPLESFAVNVAQVSFDSGEVADEKSQTDQFVSRWQQVAQAQHVADENPVVEPAEMQVNSQEMEGVFGPEVLIDRIPMRGVGAQHVTQEQITLMPGDVVVIPNRKHEVFYVVGRLNPTNTVRFTVGDRERELGLGFILPKDREIDVVTAVAMAGYIDPIDSPTTVTVQRARESGCPLLIYVDLIEARSDPKATVLVRPGDIIYLNPDTSWWLRRTIDRIIPDLLVQPYLNWIGR